MEDNALRMDFNGGDSDGQGQGSFSILGWKWALYSRIDAWWLGYVRIAGDTRILPSLFLTGFFASVVRHADPGIE